MRDHPHVMPLAACPTQQAAAPNEREGAARLQRRVVAAQPHAGLGLNLASRTPDRHPALRVAERGEARREEARQPLRDVGR
jgi:hypothetical protein